MNKLEQAARELLDAMKCKSLRVITQKETALREALAEQSYDKAHGISSYHLQETDQAEQDPVAWQFFEDGKWWIGSEYNHHRQLTEEAGYPIRELYAAPQPVTTPDVCGEVCVRAKLCYGCGKALDEANAKYVEQAEQEPEYKGWYCAHCERGVDGSEVTFHEQHEVCGRVITYDVPPKPVKQEPVAEIIGFERTNDMRGAKRIPRIKWNVPLWEDESPLQLGNLYSAPVRTKDLTDGEIEAAVLSVNATMEAWITYRAVIAADREKNK